MGDRSCPGCGRVQDESNAFCPQCGMSLAPPAARRPLPRRGDGGERPAVAPAPRASEADLLFAQLREAERTMSLEAQRSGKRRVYGCLVFVVAVTVLSMWVMSSLRSVP